jgi:arsenical pump membrane protein
LPISNPANLVVFHDAMPPLGEWLVAFSIPCLLSIATTYVVMRWIFRPELEDQIPHSVPAIKLNNSGLLVVGAVGLVIVILLVASSRGADLGLPTCVAAVGITAVVCIKEKSSPLTLAREISWETLALVGGLFIMVDAMAAIGAMNHTRQWLIEAQNLGSTSGGLIAGFGVGVANNLVNNLPLGLIAGSTLHLANASPAITDAVLIGVDLGPNLSITGSLATILWLIALRREKVEVSFWDFFRIGVVAMPAAMLVSLGGSIVMRSVFHI